MFDFLRNLTKSAESKRHEQLHAYLDDALAPRQRQQFEQEIAQDSRLQAEIDDLRLLKQQLRQLPRRPVPRRFTLDPALYGRPARQPLFQFYPVLQGATVLAALFFVLALSLSLFSQRETASAPVASAPQAVEVREAETAEEPVAEEAVELAVEESTADESVSAPALAGEAAEVTRVVTEDIVAEEVVEEAAPMEEEAPAAADAALSEGSLPQPTTLPPVAEAASPVPTATASQLPRPSATQTAAVRIQIQATEETSGQETTANNAVEQQVQPTPTPASPALTTLSSLNLLQIGLGLLLLIFGVLTIYVRRHL